MLRFPRIYILKKISSVARTELFLCTLRKNLENYALRIASKIGTTRTLKGKNLLEFREQILNPLRAAPMVKKQSILCE